MRTRKRAEPARLPDERASGASSGHTIQWVTARAFFNVMVASAGVFGIVLAARWRAASCSTSPCGTFEPMTSQAQQAFRCSRGPSASSQGCDRQLHQGHPQGLDRRRRRRRRAVAEHDRLDAFTRMDIAAILRPRPDRAQDDGRRAVDLFLVGVGDYVHQRFTWMKRQRMTREELKQEYKDTDETPRSRPSCARSGCSACAGA